LTDGKILEATTGLSDFNVERYNGDGKYLSSGTFGGSSVFGSPTATTSFVVTAPLPAGAWLAVAGFGCVVALRRRLS